MSWSSAGRWRRSVLVLALLALVPSASAQETQEETSEEIPAPSATETSEEVPPPPAQEPPTEPAGREAEVTSAPIASGARKDAAGRWTVQEVKPAPRLKMGKSIACAQLSPSRAVPSGRYRVQCDDARRECLASPMFQLDEEGVESVDPLERESPCYGDRRDYDLRAERGYPFVLAIAEAPAGWYRDERGRVMQYNFDLHRRVYLGTGWAPTQLRLETGAPRTDAARAEFGVEIEWPSDDENVLRRLHLFETALTFGVPRVDARLLRYDSSVDRVDPLFRVTTFIGRPRRLDVHFNVSPWFELLHLETLRREGEQAGFLTIAALHAALDVFHSKDQVNFLRVRAGPGLELDLERRFLTLNPSAALEGDFTLDRDGFHHVELALSAEVLLFARSIPFRARIPVRYRAKVEYEVIFLAINDQPLSLVLEANATWRDDFATVRPSVELGGLTGVRFSFWAPARRTAADDAP